MSKKRKKQKDTKKKKIQQVKPKPKFEYKCKNCGYIMRSNVSFERYDIFCLECGYKVE